MASQTVCFTVDTDEHQDILAWLAGHPEGRRSSAIRVAIRAVIQAEAEAGKPNVVDVHRAVIDLGDKLASNEVSLADVLQAISGLGEKLENSHRDLADVRQAVARLDGKLARGVMVRGGDDDAGDENNVPPEIFAKLDNLGLD
jgi:hypothetical protein